MLPSNPKNLSKDCIKPFSLNIDNFIICICSVIPKFVVGGAIGRSLV